MFTFVVLGLKPQRDRLNFYRVSILQSSQVEWRPLRSLELYNRPHPDCVPDFVKKLIRLDSSLAGVPFVTGQNPGEVRHEWLIRVCGQQVVVLT